jgi:putative FmdB family regulatory protein
MPTYEYKCRDCGEKFDLLQKITAPPVTTCPACGGPVERLISGGSGMLFKGSGFYITDYRSDKYKKAAEKEKSGNSPAASSPPEDKVPKKETTTPPKKD